MRTIRAHLAKHQEVQVRIALSSREGLSQNVWLLSGQSVLVASHGAVRQPDISQ